MKASSDGYQNRRYIHTQGGRFYILRPEWNIEWMAHSLAQTARYRGHADRQYSVAEHSVLVSLLMAEEVGGDPFEGLMHDGAEAVLPDVSSPFKGLFPDLRMMEKKLDRSIRERWKLPLTKTDECQTADWLALFIEAALLLPERGADFEDPYHLRPRALALREAKGWTVVCMPWQQAKGIFLQRYHELAPKDNNEVADSH